MNNLKKRLDDQEIIGTQKHHHMYDFHTIFVAQTPYIRDDHKMIGPTEKL